MAKDEDKKQEPKQDRFVAEFDNIQPGDTEDTGWDGWRCMGV